MDLNKKNFPNFMEKEWKIICDFDGTVALFDVTDAILKRFADPKWQDSEKEWLEGLITSRQCMEQQIFMINVSPTRLDEFLSTVPLTPGFTDFIKFCSVKGKEILIVSDGMDYVIKNVLDNHNLSGVPVIANHLCFQGDSGYKLEFPYTSECGSGVCKCNVAKVGQGKILLIGDGHSDVCLANSASFVLAKKDKVLHHHCKDKNIPHAVYDDFFDILHFFDKSNTQN